jgi:hypothetical protein
MLPELRYQFTYIVKAKALPDQLKFGAKVPNERVLPARLDFQEDWSARIIRTRKLSRGFLCLSQFKAQI